MANYEGYFKLSSFLGSRIEELEDEDGYLEKCIVIPLDRNGLIVSDEGKVTVQFFAMQAISERYGGNTHYMKQRLRKKDVERLNSLGYKAPYLGGLYNSRWATKFSTTYLAEKNQNKVKNIEDSDYE